jgi:drug/metabolite transporter (DMT)-like permease
MDQSAVITENQTRSPYRRGVILVLCAGFLWSLAGVGVRLMDGGDGWQIIFYRSAGLIPTLLLAIVLRNRGRVIQSFRRAGRTGVIAGLCLSGSFVANIYAMLNTSIANVAFIASSVPFFAALLGWILLRESVRSQTWVAILFSMIGIGIMVATSLTSEGLKGMLFAFVMVITYAAATVAIRHGKEVDMLPAVCLAGVFSLMFSGVMMSDFTLSLKDLMLCLGLGVVQVGLGMTLFTLGSKHIPAAELTLLGLIEVVLSPLWVWIVVGEQPGFWTLLGGSVVLFGVMVQAVGTRRKTLPPGAC